MQKICNEIVWIRNNLRPPCGLRIFAQKSSNFETGFSKFERPKELEQDLRLDLLEEMILEKVDGIKDRMKVVQEDIEKIKTEMKQKS